MGKKKQYLELPNIIDKFASTLRLNRPPVLDEYDLKQVQNGYLGMHNWNDDEKRLVKASKKTARRNKWVKRGLLVCLLLFAMVAAWQWRSNQRNANLALARLLGTKITSTSLQCSNSSPDSYNNLGLCFLLALHAIDISPNKSEASEYLQGVFSSPKHKASFYRQGSKFAFSPDHTKMVIGAPDGSVRFWNLTTGIKPEIINIQQGCQGPVSGIQFSVNDKDVITFHSNEKAIIWNASTGEKIDFSQEHFNSVQEVTLNSNEQIEVTIDIRGIISIRDRTTGKLKDELQMEHGGKVSAVQSSTDAQTVVTGDFDGRVAIWDASKPIWGKIESKRLHQGKVIEVKFSADNKVLVTIGSDGSVAIWDTSKWEVMQEQDQACLLAGRNLTQEEWSTHIDENRRYKRVCSQYPIGL